MPRPSIKSLAETLQWLTRPKGLRHQTYIVATPHPAESTGFKHIGERYPVYYIRLGSGPGIEEDDYFSNNPSFVYAYNYGPKDGPRNPNVPLDHPQRSDWCSIIDPEVDSASGQTMPGIILDIIRDFPKYDLQSDEGIRNTIREIETRVSHVTGKTDSSDSDSDSRS